MRQVLRSYVNRFCLPLLRRIGQEEQGVNMIIIAMAMMVLMGASAVTVDGGNAFYQQQRMQIAADAAALGGARALANGRDTLVVDSQIRQLGQTNGAESISWHYINEGRGVHVDTGRDVPTWFARLLGYAVIPVSGASEAQYETVAATDNLFPMTFSCNCIDGGESSFIDPPSDDDTTGGGCPLMPIAVWEHTFSGLAPGTTANIFNGTQPGNFGWLSWTGVTDAVALEESLRPPGTSDQYIDPDTGETGSLGPGSNVMGLTGVNSSSGVVGALDDLIGEVIQVPLWDVTTDTGSNAYDHIVGFLMVELVAYDLDAKWISARYLGQFDSCDDIFVGLATVNLGDGNTSRYDVSFIEKDGDTWTYKVRKLWGDDLDWWGLELPSCNGMFTDMGGAAFDSTLLSWTLPSGFTEGDFTFTLDDDYVSALVPIEVGAGGSTEGAELTGPDCTIRSDGVDTTGDTGTGTSLAVCLPSLDFETDDSGGSLVSGQVIDNEWAAWGVHVTTNSPASHPAMVFDSASPTGNDPDLGTPNEDFSGPGVGVGGRQNEPGENNLAQGKVLIISEDNDPSNPDDNGGGGTVIFTFDVGVRMDDVQIVDVADVARAGAVRAFSDAAGGNLLVESRMLGLGENSIQNVPVNATGVRRLEIDFPGSGGIPAVVSCRNQQTDLYRIGDMIWDDADNDGLQDENEPGVSGVELALYMDGQGQVVATTTSNSRGMYRFENLPAGTYAVKIAPSNFSSGGVLENSVLTGANVGQDALDSDFDSSTMTAQTTVPLDGGDDLTIDGGVLLAAGGGTTTAPDTVTVELTDSQGSQYEIRLVEQSGRTWSYAVREVSGRDLNYWSLGIQNCLAHIDGSSPGGALLGTDSLTGFPGIKWVVVNQFTEGVFSFTLDNDYALGSALALINGSGNVGATTIAAPDCSTVEDVIPDGGGGDGDDSCNFRWVDWDGATGTNLELAGDMNDTDHSGTWSIGRVISPGPAITNSTLVAAALNNRIGDEFVIPLSEWTGAGYEVCGFAQVRLLDFDLGADPVQMSIQFLKGMARSSDTHPTLTDYGARDVLIVD